MDSSRITLDVPDDARVVVLFSGGLDSTVLLYLALDAGLDVVALEFRYDGRPTGERDAADEILSLTDVERYVVDVPLVTGEGERILLSESNMIYYGIAANLAVKIDATHVLGGQIREDWEEFDASDATPDYYDDLADVVAASHEESITVTAPQLHSTKGEVVERGFAVDAPVERTWSCFEDRSEPCGDCYQCRTRDRLAARFDVEL